MEITARATSLMLDEKDEHFTKLVIDTRLPYSDRGGRYSIIMKFEIHLSRRHSEAPRFYQRGEESRVDRYGGAPRDILRST